MPKVAVQIGHLNGKAGALHEVETLLHIFPLVCEKLRALGIQVVEYDGSLQNTPPLHQYSADVAVFLHCDYGASNSSGFSIGYWEEMHEGSMKLATYIRQTYEKETGLPFIGYNITIGEHHYYGNRRFTHETKCVLIELGFVSNPIERAMLVSRANDVANGVVNGIIMYLEDRGLFRRKERRKEMNIISQTRVKYFSISLSPLDGEARVKVYNPNQNDVNVRVGLQANNKSVNFTLKPNELKVVEIKNLGFDARQFSDTQVIVSGDKEIDITIHQK